VIATSWQLDEDMKKRIELRLSYGHNIKTSGFADCLRQISYEAVMENLDTYLQNFQNDFGNHLLKTFRMTAGNAASRTYQRQCFIFCREKMRINR
jgi:hypothetical protein